MLFGGDILTSEYLLLNLFSKMYELIFDNKLFFFSYRRNDYTIIGKFCLNISNCPENNQVIF